MIKVQLVRPSDSMHRGIGLYASSLASALKDIKALEIVDSDPDIVHYPYFDLFFPSLPLFHRQPVVVTVHDLTPLVLSDLYPLGTRAKINLFRQRLALGRAAAILTDSNNSHSDLVRIWGLPQNKIFVTPLGVDTKFFIKLPVRKLNSVVKRLSLPKTFVLTIAGGPNPNKNLVRLAQATQLLNIPLVIVGRGLLEVLPEKNIHAELRDLAKLKEFTHLILPGFVSDEDLVALYQLAGVYCQASLYEGFGLPLLEAMAAGCLIASASVASLPEIYPSDTLTFHPTSVDEIYQSLKTALKLNLSARSRRIRHGKKRAAEFTWWRTAQLTFKAYQFVYEARKHY